MTPQNSPQQPPSRQPGKIARMLSIERIKAEVKAVSERFPVTLVFIGLATLYALTCVWDANWPDHVNIAACVSLSLACLLSLAAYLWCEYLHAERRSLLWQLLTIAFALVNFIYLYNRAEYLSLADGIGYSAAYTALVVAIFFLPIARRSSIKLQWLYSVNVLEAVALALLLQIVLGIFVSIVFGTISLLFGVSSFKLSMSFGIVLAGALPVMAGLCYLPRATDIEAQTERDTVQASAISAFTKNVLMPLALVYTVILYVYGLKILFTLTLPNGYICWMVTGIVSAVLLIVYGLQGYICSAGTKAATKRLAAIALRWFPAILLPLLVLMSVAIFYRINQYGITTSRLYVATFNIWAYFAVAYLIIAKLPKLNLVATSFAVIFLLTSVIPHFNYCTWGISAVQHKVTEALKTAGAEKFPLSYEELLDIVGTLSEDEAENIAYDLDYLDDWDNHSAVESIVKSRTRIYRWEIMNACKTPSAKFEARNEVRALSPVPQGFASVEYMTKYDYSDFATHGGKYPLKMPNGQTVDIPVDSLCRISTESIRFVPARLDIVDRPGDIFMLTDYNINGDRRREKPYSYISVSGYYFTNNTEP